MAKQLSVADVEKGKEWERRYYSYKNLTDLLNKPCHVVISSHEEVKKARGEALFAMLTKKA